MSYPLVINRHSHYISHTAHGTKKRHAKVLPPKEFLRRLGLAQPQQKLLGSQNLNLRVAIIRTMIIGHVLCGKWNVRGDEVGRSQLQERRSHHTHTHTHTHQTHRAPMVICTAVGSTTDRLGGALASAACSSDTGGALASGTRRAGERIGDGSQ